MSNKKKKNWTPLNQIGYEIDIMRYYIGMGWMIVIFQYMEIIFLNVIIISHFFN